MSKKYPSVKTVYDLMTDDAPAFWAISYEYPDTIGVRHPSFVNDYQFINFGDINGFFAWDSGANDYGDMEGITDAGQIVNLFWQQIKKLYPELLKNWAVSCGACGLFYDEDGHTCDENPLWEVIAWHQEQFNETVGVDGQEKENEMHSDFIDILRKAVSQ